MEYLDKTFVQGHTLNAADLNDIVSKINEGVDEFNTLAAENMTDTIYIDFNKTSPSQIITGDVNGDVIKWIRKNSHRYLAKKTDEGKMTICQLSDGNSGIFAGDGSTAPLDGSQGDVMVHIPRFFYHAQAFAADKWQIDFSPVKVSAAWQEYDGKQLIGAYEGYVNNGKLYSRSGVDSAAGITPDVFRDYARARGNGYTLTPWEQHNVMAILFYAKYGNTNSQGVIGSGTNGTNKQTGQTDSLGMEDTHAETNGNTMSINFWGLENWWGNKYEFVDNVSVNPVAANGIWRITEKDGHTRDVQGATKETEGMYYPKSMHVGQHLDMIPTTLGGSSTSSLCDAFYYYVGIARTVRRSGRRADADGGCVHVSTTCCYDNYSGARLSFAGEIHIERDVNAFKAL